MTQMPTESVLSWAADAVGAGARVVAVNCLHEGRTGPWMLRIDRAGSTSDVVLRVFVPGWISEEGIATGAAALLVVEEHGLAAPRLIASDLDGRAGGAAATLETALPGSSALPPTVTAERLLGRPSRVVVGPRPCLPRPDRKHGPRTADGGVPGVTGAAGRHRGAGPAPVRLGVPRPYPAGARYNWRSWMLRSTREIPRPQQHMQAQQQLAR